MQPKKPLFKLAALCCLLLASRVSVAQTSVDFGRNEFMASCASCHGITAKGEGGMRQYLTKPPTDLTRLSRDNGGVFPSQRIWEVIDGRIYAPIGSHGAREMPVWGYIYRAEDTQPADIHARNRIAALLDYLVRIQEK